MRFLALMIILCNGSAAALAAAETPRLLESAGAEARELRSHHPSRSSSACLDETFSTPYEAGSFLLAAVAAGDEKRARAASITREEFERVIWPELPVSRPGSTFTLDFVWEQHALRDAFGFAKFWNRHVGRHVQLVEIHLGDSVAEYATFRVYRRPAATVLDEHGNEKRIRLAGSLIEQDGRFKIYGFNND